MSITSVSSSGNTFQPDTTVRSLFNGISRVSLVTMLSEFLEAIFPSTEFII